MMSENFPVPKPTQKESLLRRWFQKQTSQLSIRHKIIVGYIVILMFTATGTLFGVIWGMNGYRYVSNQVKTSHLNVSAISNLSAVLERVLVSRNDLLMIDPTTEAYPIRQRLIHDDVAQAQTYLTNLLALSPARSVPRLHQVLSMYGPRSRTYLQRIDATLYQLESTKVQSAKFKAARQQLKADLHGPDLQDLISLGLQLDGIKTSVELQNQQAWDQLNEFANFQYWIVLGSLGISVVLALIVARIIGRAIAAPLLAVHHATERITQEENFDWPIPITTDDEVGQLARSIAQLVTHIRLLLAEQQANNQAQLLQNEKMASLGRMLAGIAHEINNPINFTYGNLAHLENYVHDLTALLQVYRASSAHQTPEIAATAQEIDLPFVLEDLPKVLQSMRIGLDRTRQIIKSLKDFSRLDSNSPHIVNLESCIESTLLILQNRLKYDVDLVIDYQTVPDIEGYAGLLYQVFANLISNAIDALEGIGASDSGDHCDGQELASQGLELSSSVKSVLDSGVSTQQSATGQQVSTESNRPPKPTLWITTEQAKPGFVQVRIRDNGPGMPAKVRDRIFETFFTTKNRHEGTGLGLAISHQIITEKHQGQLLCHSQVGQGTEFIVVLPVQQISLPLVAVQDPSTLNISGPGEPTKPEMLADRLPKPKRQLYAS